MKWIAVLILVILTACAPEPSGRTVYKAADNTNVRRYVDEEAGVACWFFMGRTDAISCLPLDQTLLGKE